MKYGRSWLLWLSNGFYIVPSPMLQIWEIPTSFDHGPERISTLASAWVPGSSAQFMWLVVDEQVGLKVNAMP